MDYCNTHLAPNIINCGFFSNLIFFKKYYLNSFIVPTLLKTKIMPKKINMDHSFTLMIFIFQTEVDTEE